MTEKEIKIKTMELLYRQLESLEEKCKDEQDLFVLLRLADQIGKIGGTILMSKIEDEFGKSMSMFIESQKNKQE